MLNRPTDSCSSLQTRPSLLFRLRNWKDTASWEEFYRLYQRLVLGYSIHSGLSHSEAEEVTQDVFMRVAETIHEFESNPERGSFRGWLMKLTRWRIVDKFRERHRVQHHILPHSGASDDRTSTIERIPEQPSETTWDVEWQQHVLDAALSRLARRVSPHHFQAFELYSRQGWPVTRVAQELGLGIASVYVISHRLTKQLKDEVGRLRLQLG